VVLTVVTEVRAQFIRMLLVLAALSSSVLVLEAGRRWQF
jgi:hypothetical protein